jgi:hypothetical protein
MLGPAKRTRHTPNTARPAMSNPPPMSTRWRRRRAGAAACGAFPAAAGEAGASEKPAGVGITAVCADATLVWPFVSFFDLSKACWTVWSLTRVPPFLLPCGRGLGRLG